MMNTTHAVMGAALATVTTVTVPEFAVTAAMAAMVGSVLPDLDIALGVHRRTLHYPVIGWAVAIPVVAAAVAVPDSTTVAIAFLLTGFALHSSVDILGGGPEARPWAVRSDRGVYAHVPGRWLRARRWIRYDGAPEDFLLGLAMAVPVLWAFDGIVVHLVLICLGISVPYTVFRKRIPDLTDRYLF